MKSKLLGALLLIGFFPLSGSGSFAIPLDSASPKRLTTSKRIYSATGTYISYDGGNGMGWYKLNINGKVQEFFMNRDSQFDRASFLKKNSHDVGAEWRITYSYENLFDGAPVPHIRTAFFTGRVLNGSQRSGNKDEQWIKFWDNFTVAVQKRDRTALKMMMAPKVEVFFEEMTPNQVFRELDKGKNWTELHKAIYQGAIEFKPPRQWTIQGVLRIAPPQARTNKYLGYRAVFQLKPTGWKWVVFTSGD